MLTKAVKIAPATGRCLCGATTFEADLPATAEDVVEVSACHCGMCRRWGDGGPFIGVHLEAPARFAEGSPIGLYRGSDWAERGFCSVCGSNLFWRMHDGSNMTMPAGLFDDQTRFRLASEIYIDAKPGFYALEGERPRLTEAEVIALFAGGDAPT